MFTDDIAMISFNVSLTNMPLVVSATMQEKDTILLILLGCYTLTGYIAIPTTVCFNLVQQPGKPNHSLS